MATECKLCHKPSEPENYIRDRIREIMEEKQLCFNCAFWLWQHELDTQEREPHTAVIVEGTHYVIGSETKSKSTFFRGFGGAHFKIKFHDGTEVETTNLWCQGEIPEHLRHLLPDNAEFLNTKE